MTRGQGECTPEPLPYFEDFSTGFEWDNGWYIPWLDTTYQEDDHCWTLCWLHASEWNTLVHTGALSRRPIELRIRINKINDIYNLIDEYKFAVSPHMAAAPWRLQFEAGYYNAYPDINYDIQQADLQLTDGARLAIGYVTDDNDCINSYVPFDTLKVSGHWVYPEEILQPFDIDLGRYFDTFPEPWRIAFRPEKTDEYQDVLLLVDNIRISDELSEYHCTADYVDTICQGTGYYHHGFHILPQRTNDLGTRHYSYVDTTGCLVSLDLTVTGTHTTILVDTVPCGQPSPYAPDTVLGEGSHYFHLSDRYGCDSLVTITIHQAWVTHLYDSIQEGDTLLFEGQTLTSGGIYTHDTVASDGCDSLVVLHLRCLPLPAVNTDTLTFWFPNVFTPGRDDNNRFGCITATEMLEFEMFIFNRWGLMVFHTEDINDWWDGGGLPQGAYVYTYRLRTPDGRVYTGKGTVTLLR
ncbi:MAG: gliding motility-associated C-terminal domain-containing protein [Bacteroidales bacterium]|nr:gliding motility-associated C-terminal domain-containing protein [Bacteroidales bacterium]